MHFCTKCGNMYYLKIGGTEDKESDPDSTGATSSSPDENTLIYYCRHCGHEDNTLASSNICVANTQLAYSTQKYTHTVNEFTKVDPTLPRTTSIRCPNQSCPSNLDKKSREVIYLRYDDANMRYLYMCAVCNYTWKTDEMA